MTAPTTDTAPAGQPDPQAQPQNGAAPPGSPASTPPAPRRYQRLRRRYRLAALGLVALGLLLLASNLGLLAAPVARALAVAGPLLLLALGLWLAVRGRAGGVDALPSFSVPRGSHAGATLRVSSGNADVRVGHFAGASQLAVGAFPAPDGPLLTTIDGQPESNPATRAELVLGTRQAWPWLPGLWQASLAKGLPWRFDLESSLGDFELDLRDLTVESLRLRSSLGNVALTLPAAGQPELDLALTTGNLHLRLPDGMDVKLSVRAGTLANVHCQSRRCVEVAPGEWVTPLYAAAAQRCTLTVRLGTGDLRLE